MGDNITFQYLELEDPRPIDDQRLWTDQPAPRSPQLHCTKTGSLDPRSFPRTVWVKVAWRMEHDGVCHPWLLLKPCPAYAPMYIQLPDRQQFPGLWDRANKEMPNPAYYRLFHGTQ